jgi:uncharacterized membrane protein YfbV (UPF0208 family)
MYDNAVATDAKCIEVRRLTLTERLKEERTNVNSRLQELDQAITALEAQPEMQRLLDIIQKVARY